MSQIKAGSWCYISSGGRVLADNAFMTEDDAWRVCLGWPTRGEVRAAKDRGDKVVWVEITEVAA